MTLNPKVDIDIRTAISLSPNIGEAIGMLVGTAQYGPVNKIITTSNMSSVLQIFKDDKDEHTSIIKAAELFFSNGGSILKIVRITDDSDTKATLDLDGATQNGVITVEALYTGEYGNNIIIEVTEFDTNKRAVRVKVGNSVEYYDNNGKGFETNKQIVDAINSQSKFVSLSTTHDDTDLVKPIANTGWALLDTGTNGNEGLSLSNYGELFDDIIANDDWDILMIPNTYQSVSVENTDAFHTAITAKVENRANTLKKYGIYVSGVSTDESINDIQNRVTSSERFVLTAPNIMYDSKIDNKVIVLDGTYLACALAGKIAELDDIGGSPTRKVVNVRDLSVDTSTDKKYYDNVEIEQLLSSRVVPASKIGNSLRYARGVTRYNDTTSVFFEINILRIVDNIKTTIQDTLEEYLGEPNSTITRERMKGITNGILEIARNKGLLNSYLPTVVTEGVTPDTVSVAITIKPAYSANFIDVMITIS